MQDFEKDQQEFEAYQERLSSTPKQAKELDTLSDRLKLQKEYFTNPEFRKKLEDYVLEILKKKEGK